MLPRPTRAQGHPLSLSFFLSLALTPCDRTGFATSFFLFSLQLKINQTPDYQCVYVCVYIHIATCHSCQSPHLPVATLASRHTCFTHIAMNEYAFVLLQAFQAVCLVLKLIYTYVMFFTFVSIYSSQPPSACITTISQAILVTIAISFGLLGTITNNSIHVVIYAAAYLAIYLLTLINCGTIDPVIFALDTVILALSLTYLKLIVSNTLTLPLNPYVIVSNRYIHSQMNSPFHHSSKIVDSAPPCLPKISTHPSSSPFYSPQP